MKNLSSIALAFALFASASMNATGTTPAATPAATDAAATTPNIFSRAWTKTKNGASFAKDKVVDGSCYVGRNTKDGAIQTKNLFVAHPVYTSVLVLAVASLGALSWKGIKFAYAKAQTKLAAMKAAKAAKKN